MQRFPKSGRWCNVSLSSRACAGASAGFAKPSRRLGDLGVFDLDGDLDVLDADGGGSRLLCVPAGSRILILAFLRRDR